MISPFSFQTLTITIVKINSAVYRCKCITSHCAIWCNTITLMGYARRKHVCMMKLKSKKWLVSFVFMYSALWVDQSFWAGFELCPLFQYPITSLIVRSREDSKQFKFSHCFQIWLAHQISERLDNYQYKSRLPDVTRSHDKISYRMWKRGPGSEKSSSY